MIVSWYGDTPCIWRTGCTETATYYPTGSSILTICVSLCMYMYVYHLVMKCVIDVNIYMCDGHICISLMEYCQTNSFKCVWYAKIGFDNFTFISNYFRSVFVNYILFSNYLPCPSRYLWTDEKISYIMCHEWRRGKVWSSLSSHIYLIDTACLPQQRGISFETDAPVCNRK